MGTAELCPGCREPMDLRRGRRVWHCPSCGHERRFHRHLDAGRSSIARIYALEDPRTGAVRYVGQTVRRLRDRLYEHVEECLVRPVRTRRQRWIYGLYLAHLAPVIVELERVPYMERDAAERHWIGQFRRAGADLVNTLPGGNEITRFDRQVAREKATAAEAQAIRVQIDAQVPKGHRLMQPQSAPGPLEWPNAATTYSVALRTTIDSPNGWVGPSAGRYRLATSKGACDEGRVQRQGQFVPDEAEYHTLIAAVSDILDRIAAHPRKLDPSTFSLAVYSFREIVVKQIRGECKVTAASLQAVHGDAQALLRRFGTVEAIWQPKTQISWLFRQPPGARIRDGLVIRDDEEAGRRES